MSADHRLKRADISQLRIGDDVSVSCHVQQIPSRFHPQDLSSYPIFPRLPDRTIIFHEIPFFFLPSRAVCTQIYACSFQCVFYGTHFRVTRFCFLFDGRSSILYSSRLPHDRNTASPFKMMHADEPRFLARESRSVR